MKVIVVARRRPELRLVRFRRLWRLGTLIRFWTLLLLLGVLQIYSQSQVATGRLLTLDDLFNLQQISKFYGGGVALSPDGARLAFAIQRPYRTKQLFTDGLFGADRSDMYVASSTDSRPTKIADGLADGATFWSPAWSPDGKHLAMLSSRGGNVSLWVWETSTGSLRQVTDRTVDLSLTGAEDRPYLWLSSTRILFTALSPGVRPNWFAGSAWAAQRAMREWRKAWQGKSVSASVLTTGVKSDLNKRPQSSLVEIDIALNKDRVLTDQTVRNISVSPDLKAIAYLLKVEGFQPQSNRPLPMNDLFKDRAGMFALEIRSLEGKPQLSKDANALDVVPMSLRWSADGKELAFLVGAKDHGGLIQLVRFIRSKGTLQRTSLEEIDPIPSSKPGLIANRPQLEWTPSGWLVYAAPRTNAEAEHDAVRRDWWLVSDDGVKSITKDMPAAPAELLSAFDDETYIGLAAGELWRIGPRVQPQNLTPAMGKRITRIVWPQEVQRAGNAGISAHGRYERLLVGTNEGIFVLDLPTARMDPVALPASGAAVIAFSTSSRGSVFYKNDQTGMRLWWLSELGKSTSLVYEANAFLKEVLPGATQQIAYKSLDGEELKGWLILPPSYQQGQKCPLIVSVYPNQVAGPSAPPIADISFVSHLNMQIPAARGYAILQPSIPLNAYDQLDDPLLKLTSAVLPAVDKVIESGIADPDRIFVMGQSNGGYATYGLVTQTNRFRAAVAMAGYSDLISGYGQPGINRYDDYAQELLTATQQPTIETVLHLGGPPVSDLGRYLKNSPIFYVDRVQTPLMIIHGDLDGVPIEQAEEFFMALYRQGKRAEFVRYWGEGHLIESPSNIRDMWQRIFAWFDEFSPKPEVKKPNERNPN